MSRKDGILHLVVYARVWDEIKAGRKPVEYRDLRWFPRLTAGAYKMVRFQRGFHKVDGKVPTMLFWIDRFDQGPVDPRWTCGVLTTPPDWPYVRIWLGDPILPFRSLAALARGGFLW